MCNIVYLTHKRFDRDSKYFVKKLEEELLNRKIEVVCDNSYDFLNCLRKHKTFGISIAFDFFKDECSGCGLTLNKNCSTLGRDFAYNLSNSFDLLVPSIHWRDFNFVDSYDKSWFDYFNKISSNVKIIFYLCTKNNVEDYNNYSIFVDRIVKLFADEIIRCLRSGYSIDIYRKRTKIARTKMYKTSWNC